MPIQCAIDLLNAIDDNKTLRKQMYGCESNDALMEFLKKEGYTFTVDEFEESVRALHVKCQTLEAAQELLHKADWLRFLLTMN